MTRWFLIIADRLGMATAEAALRRLGHEVYYPREKIAVTRLNRRVKVERALLYSYAFVGVQLGGIVEPIRQAKGVYRLLNDIDGNPARISESTVERFRRNERYGVYDHTKRGKRAGPLKRGQPVVVVDGHWIDWSGIVERCGEVRAHVDMGTMVIEFRVDHLVPV